MAEIKENKLRNISQKNRKKTVIAAYRNNNKNQMKCILKGKPKNMNEYWRMPLPTAPHTTSVTVVRVIPPMTTVGRRIVRLLRPQSLTTHGDRGIRRRVSLEYLGYLRCTSNKLMLAILATSYHFNRNDRVSSFY